MKVDQLIEKTEEMTARVLACVFEIAWQDSEQKAKGRLGVTLRVVLSGQFVEAGLEVIFYAVLVAVENAWHDQLIYILQSQYVIEQGRVLSDAADPNAEAIWDQNFFLRCGLFIFPANNTFKQTDQLWLHLFVIYCLEKRLVALH